jgi:uncharacterized protein YhaN
MSSKTTLQESFNKLEMKKKSDLELIRKSNETLTELKKSYFQERKSLEEKIDELSHELDGTKQTIIELEKELQQEKAKSIEPSVSSDGSSGSSFVMIGGKNTTASSSNAAVSNLHSPYSPNNAASVEDDSMKTMLLQKENEIVSLQEQMLSMKESFNEQHLTVCFLFIVIFLISFLFFISFPFLSDCIITKRVI